MNWQQGLERMSAIWWGFFGLLCSGGAVAALLSHASDKAAMFGLGLAGVAVCFIAHKVTCWVLAGFFAPHS